MQGCMSLASALSLGFQPFGIGYMEVGMKECDRVMSRCFVPSLEPRLY